MTLSTMVVLHEWTDPIELHTWFNANVLMVADKNPRITRTTTHIGNDLGQGFSAIFDIDWNADQSPLVWFDPVAERESMKDYYDKYPEQLVSTAEHYAKFPQGVVKIDWDTSYGYSGPAGQGCSDLHAYFIHRLATDYLTPRGIGFSWQNEYTGEWNEGLSGFEAFGTAGVEANDWFRNIALPAIEQEMQR